MRQIRAIHLPLVTTRPRLLSATAMQDTTRLRETRRQTGTVRADIQWLQSESNSRPEAITGGQLAPFNSNAMKTKAGGATIGKLELAK